MKFTWSNARHDRSLKTHQTRCQSLIILPKGTATFRNQRDLFASRWNTHLKLIALAYPRCEEETWAEELEEAASLYCVNVFDRVDSLSWIANKSNVGRRTPRDEDADFIEQHLLPFVVCGLAAVPSDDILFLIVPFFTSPIHVVRNRLESRRKKKQIDRHFIYFYICLYWHFQLPIMTYQSACNTLPINEAFKFHWDWHF